MKLLFLIAHCTASPIDMYSIKFHKTFKHDPPKLHALKGEEKGNVLLWIIEKPKTNLFGGRKPPSPTRGQKETSQLKGG